MRSITRSAVVSRTLLLVLATALLVVGCNRDQTPSEASFNTEAALIEDPFEGVLNSTVGSTPTDLEALIDKLAEVLGLDDEQKAALLDAYGGFRDEIAALKDQVEAGEITREEAKALAGPIREAFEAELQLILTEEQYDQLQEMRQNRKGRGRGHRDPGARWDAWLEEIGADEEQSAAVDAALATLRDGIKALREQVKAGELTREEAKPQVETLREEFDAALQTILTPEQYAALEELRPDCRSK